MYHVISSVSRAWTILKESIKPPLTHAPNTHTYTFIHIYLHSYVCALIHMSADQHMYMHIEFLTHSFMIPGCSIPISAAVHPSPFLHMDFPGGKATSPMSVDSERTQHSIRRSMACSRFVAHSVCMY